MRNGQAKPRGGLARAGGGDLPGSAGRKLPPEFAPGVLLGPDELLALEFCGPRARVYKGCRVFPPERISLGEGSQIDEGVWIFAGQNVRIGKYTHLAAGSSISGGGACSIGNFVGIGVGVRMITGTEVVDDGGLTNPTVPMEFRSVRRGKVTIEDHAVVFTNAVIFPDVVIGEGAVVSAGAIVHRSLKPWTIYAGNPLVPIKARERDEVLQKARAILEAPF